MVGRKIHRIPVMRGKHLESIITRHDVLKLMGFGKSKPAQVPTQSTL